MFATVQDLVDRWRPLSSEEEARAETLLGDAAVEIRSEFRRAGWVVEDRVLEGEVTEDELKVTSCEMVKRAMLAPVDAAPMAQMQQSAGPFSQGGTFVNPTGDLYLTRKDRRRLGLGGQVAFSAPMAAPLAEDPYWWML